MILEKMTNTLPENGPRYRFHCPGCGFDHILGGSWTFNGDMERPTFAPSFLITAPLPRCHLFIRNGQLQYCKDSDHDLAGQTVDMPELTTDIIQR